MFYPFFPCCRLATEFKKRFKNELLWSPWLTSSLSWIPDVKVIQPKSMPDRIVEKPRAQLEKQ